MSGGRRVLEHISRQIARGYRPTTTWSTPVTYVVAADSGPVEAPRWSAALPPGEVRIGMLLATHVQRCPLAEQERQIDELLERLDEVRRSHPHVTVVFFVGMQWRETDEEHESLRRLRALANRASGHHGVVFAGLSLRGPLKVRTLNAAIRTAEEIGLAGLGWIDDDVRLEPGCLDRMIDSFLSRGCRGAVGATKVPHAREHLTSKLLHRAKAIAAPATNYPHGCCILVATEVVRGGIPDRYVSDDGYVCFQLLDPAQPDPMHDLHLVPDARCHYHVAGPAGETRRRIRRLLLNHHIYLADWPVPVARYYFQEILFAGLWPLARFDRSRGVAFGIKKACIKWLYFAWFAAIGAELYVRGIVGRPLRQVFWASYTDLAVPAMTAEPALPKGSR